jgi:hypothetical protein
LNGLAFVDSDRADGQVFGPNPDRPEESSLAAHFVDTNHDPIARRIAIQAYDLVFFTSNSGS